MINISRGGIVCCLAICWILLPSSQGLAAPSEKDSSTLSGFAELEARPEPRLGLSVRHGGFASEAWFSTVSVGLGALGDVELRTAPILDWAGSSYPWLAWRIRPVNLEGLPPIEHYVVFGLGFSSDWNNRWGWDAGIGAQWQLPPLAPEPADDFNTYFVENVQMIMRFTLRLKVF
ncbi:MAG: hypothetical protein VYC39_05260 [Myxococcota bacterium]|nr:hypothetical protein [Myxococcota bacterium]